MNLWIQHESFIACVYRCGMAHTHTLQKQKPTEVSQSCFKIIQSAIKHHQDTIKQSSDNTIWALIFWSTVFGKRQQQPQISDKNKWCSLPWAGASYSQGEQDIGWVETRWRSHNTCNKTTSTAMRKALRCGSIQETGKNKVELSMSTISYLLFPGNPVSSCFFVDSYVTSRICFPD